MKFSVFNWDEVNAEETHQTPKGWLRVQCSQDAALYITTQGYEALAGVGTLHEVQLSEASTWRVEAPSDVRVFVRRSPGTTHKHEGETFTNIDRMSNESGTVLEVRKALRELELQRRSVMRDIQSARRQLDAKPKAKDEAKPDQKPEPKPEPKPEEEVQKDGTK